MFFSLGGLIGVYTSFSGRSLLDLPSIQKLAIENGFKVIGISDPDYVFWIDEILNITSSIKFFTAIEKTFNIAGGNIKVYLYFRDAQSLFKFSRGNISSLKELKYLDCVVFYSGSSKEHFLYIYDIFLGNTGFAFTPSNKHLLDFALSKVDYILPFHYSTIPPELEKYSEILKKFIPKPSPFLTISKFIKEMESLPQAVIEKLNYTVESIVDVREFDFSHSKKQNFSELFWNKIISSLGANTNEKVRSEFLKIKEVNLEEFFYKLVNSLEEFSKYGYVNSDLLSNSFILEKLSIFKFNKRKIISLKYFLNELPLYVDIRTNSVSKLKEVIQLNFSDEVFYKVSPVHISDIAIERKIGNLNSEVKDYLKKYLKKLVVSFRTSNKLFFSNHLLRQKVGSKRGINKEFSGKRYDVILDISPSYYLYSKNTVCENFFSVVKDDLFLVPEVFSLFWDEIKNKVSILGFSDALRMFYIGLVLSQKPYLKNYVEEMIENKVPFFVEDFLPKNFSERFIEDLINFLHLKDKRDRYIISVDLFRLLIEEGINKGVAEGITRNLSRYRNIIGIKSLVIPRFYDFLASACFFSKNKVAFISNVLLKILKNNKKVANEVFRKLIKNGFDVSFPDVNKSNLMSILLEERKIYLPLFVCNINFEVLKEILEERKKGKFRNFFEFYARIGKKYPRESNRLVKCGAFDGIDSRESILKLESSFSNFNKKLILVSEEIRSMGFSITLLKTDFDSFRKDLGVLSITEVKEGKGSVFLGFVLHSDSYGNLFVADDTSTIFVKNNVFLNIKVGNYGLFTVNVEKGILGDSFYLKFFERL
ncbi:MAG: hypothetical protein ACP5KI_04895 [Brevinematia bacterium]